MQQISFSRYSTRQRWGAGFDTYAKRPHSSQCFISLTWQANFPIFIKPSAVTLHSASALRGNNIKWILILFICLVARRAVETKRHRSRLPRVIAITGSFKARKIRFHQSANRSSTFAPRDEDSKLRRDSLPSPHPDRENCTNLKREGEREKGRNY